MTEPGEFVPGRPGDPEYETATRVFNLAAPVHPAAAVTARSVDQVRAAVRHAAAAGLRVRMFTSGHGAGAARPMPEALLIRTELGGGVEVDPAGRVARVPAGTRAGELVAATAKHGLTSAHGSSANVGLVNYLLGGGLSGYGRFAGLAVNGVRAVELVTADGEARRVDAAHDPELFRALRGGGGGFGVVTAVELALFPAGQLFGGATYWRGELAEAVLARWNAWTAGAPREVTAGLRLLNLPAVPGVPPALAGSTTICVDGLVRAASTGEAHRVADTLLRPLYALGEPLADTWQDLTPEGVLGIHMDPPEPVPFLGEHHLLSTLDDRGEAALLGLLGPGSGSPFVGAGLRQLGGAFATAPAGAGVLGHLDAAFSFAASGVPDPTGPERLLAHGAKARVALEPWRTGRTVPNFVEHFEQPQRHLDADQVAEVDRVRLRVDPEGLFRDDIAPNATALS
ncbi:FAD binding domain-containing protein [Amycolatopsis pretoriensis]|uniref:FAD binding domain-containing protein n=1 Tax=Amycolatopsis pretoriensis TaxID=218821 RepID=A0A1H5R4E1_9PSEU|nr:FAD-binding protein [Amycolatopsis pretoriensis]SEF33266.1 FAD binding domain-containing protein [Amycolatopsis pretoriensis]